MKKVIFISLLLLPIFLTPLSCAQSKENTPTVTPVTPTAACNMAYVYLDSRINTIKSLEIRNYWRNRLQVSRARFSAAYSGEGRWSVATPLGLWLVHENSGIAEPLDDEAKDVFVKIQRYT